MIGLVASFKTRAEAEAVRAELGELFTTDAIEQLELGDRDTASPTCRELGARYGFEWQRGLPFGDPPQMPRLELFGRQLLLWFRLAPVVRATSMVIPHPPAFGNDLPRYLRARGAEVYPAAHSEVAIRVPDRDDSDRRIAEELRQRFEGSRLWALGVVHDDGDNWLMVIPDLELAQSVLEELAASRGGDAWADIDVAVGHPTRSRIYALVARLSCSECLTPTLRFSADRIGDPFFCHGCGGMFGLDGLEIRDPESAAMVVELFYREGDFKRALFAVDRYRHLQAGVALTALFLETAKPRYSRSVAPLQASQVRDIIAAMDVGPDQLETALGIGFAYGSLDDPGSREIGVAILERIMAADIDYSDEPVLRRQFVGTCRVALLFLQRDDLERAAKLADELQEVAAEEPEIHHTAAIIFVKLGSLQRALEQCRRGIDRDPTMAERLYVDQRLVPLRELAEFRDLTYGALGGRSEE